MLAATGVIGLLALTRVQRLAYQAVVGGRDLLGRVAALSPPPPDR